MLTPKQIENLIRVLQDKIDHTEPGHYDFADRDFIVQLDEEYERARDARDDEQQIWRQTMETARLEWLNR
jgi:hypothetical protein